MECWLTREEGWKESRFRNTSPSGPVVTCADAPATRARTAIATIFFILLYRLSNECAYVWESGSAVWGSCQEIACVDQLDLPPKSGWLICIWIWAEGIFSGSKFGVIYMAFSSAQVVKTMAIPLTDYNTDVFQYWTCCCTWIYWSGFANLEASACHGICIRYSSMSKSTD